MITEIITATISAFSAILVAIVAKRSEKSHKEEQKRTERRQKESLLSLQLMDANCSLTVGVAMALKHGHCNGEVEEGLKRVKAAQEAYMNFERTVLSEELSK